MFSIKPNRKISHLCSVLFNPSLVRPLILICLIVVFGVILPIWSAPTPNALAWFTNNLFQNADFETGTTVGQPPPSPWTVSPSNQAVITTTNRTPNVSNGKGVKFIGMVNGGNIDLKQRVDIGVTAGQDYYLGSFGAIDSGTPGGQVGIAYGYGANTWPPPIYQNCGFGYANYDGTVGSYGLLSCDFVVPNGYNYVAPKMSFNAASPHWAVTDDWYLVAAPNHTTSRYVNSLSTSTFDSWGCSSAQRNEGGTIILDFGQPWWDGTQYGTNTFATPNPFASTWTIATLAESFLNGYWRCGSTQSATIVIGTSNCSAGSGQKICKDVGGYVGQPHGQAWSQMVLLLRTYILANGYWSRETVVGGNDIEPGWGPAATSATDVANWIAGYQSVLGYAAYFDFGSADGMPFDIWFFNTITGKYQAGCPNCSGTNGWSQGALWYAAWGATAARPFPEIYFRDGRNAAQWYRMSLYNSSNRMLFQGTLTQLAACNGGCNHGTATASDNTPATGWGQLMHFLNFDSRVYISGTPASSDITW